MIRQWLHSKAGAGCDASAACALLGRRSVQGKDSNVPRFYLTLSFAACAIVATASLPAQAPAPPPAVPYGPPITFELARRVAAVAEAEAKARHVAVTIAIVDSGGTLVLENRLDGASLVSADTAPAKAKSAVLWQRPTSSWISTLSGNLGPLTLPHVIASQGGELLVVNGKIIGAVGVGGSVENEGEIAKRAAASLKANGGTEP